VLGVFWFGEGITIVDFDGGGRRAVAIGSIAATGSSARRAASTRDLSMAWSPDGRKIVFSRKCRMPAWQSVRR
jgi:WD40-like Beta Propeller Repeat